MTMAVRATVKLYDTMDANPLVIGEEAMRDLEEAVLRKVVSSAWLSAESRRQGDFYFSATMKLHYHIHIAQAARRSKINPKNVSTALDEDFVGRMSAVVRACAKSLGPARCTKQVLEKYLRMVLTRSQTDFKAKWTVGMGT